MKSTKYYADIYGVIPRRIRKLCEQKRVVGAFKDDHNNWLIPENAVITKSPHGGPLPKITFSQ